jgi:hypothetical protein
MAAKNLNQAIHLANIDIEIKKALCIGPAYEFTQRIDNAEKIIAMNVRNELKDFLAHRIMIFSKDLPDSVQVILNAFHEEIFK